MNKNILKITTILCGISTLPLVSQAEWETVQKGSKTHEKDGYTASTTIKRQIDMNYGIYEGERVVTNTNITNDDGNTVATGTSTFEDGKGETEVKTSTGVEVDIESTTNYEGTIKTNSAIKNKDGDTVATGESTYDRNNGSGSTKITTTKGGTVDITYTDGYVSDVDMETAKGTKIIKSEGQTYIKTPGGESATVNKNSDGSRTVTTSEGKSETVTKNSDGSRTVTNARDGSVTKYKDGQRTIDTARGATIQTTGTGSASTTTDRGTEVTFTENSKGNTTTTIEGPNEGKITINKNRVTTKGSSSTKSTSTQSSTESAGAVDRNIQVTANNPNQDTASINRARTVNKTSTGANSSVERKVTISADQYTYDPNDDGQDINRESKKDVTYDSSTGTKTIDSFEAY